MSSSNPEVCGPLRAIVAPGGDREHRLRVATSDLLQGTIRVRVVENGSTLVNAPSPSNPEGISSSVLCKGLWLYAGPRDRSPVRLSVDLDDP